jgi:AraC-like DNA-binding protein
MSKRTTAAVWLRGIVEMFTAEGLDAKAVLADAGIDPTQVVAPGARIATEKMSRIWELAVERSGNPAIGLAQHQVARPASFDVVGYTMMSCPNLQAAFERLERYLRILSDALTMRQGAENGSYRVSFDLNGGDRPVPRQRMDFILATLMTFCRWSAGREVNPAAVAISYPAPPPYQSLYGEVFRCPVMFDAPQSSFLFALTELKKPLSTSNPILAELHERYAGEYLKHFDHGETTFRVREVIIRRLPDGEPRRDQVAKELCMSERTLQRRLEQEASCFLKLLNDTRRELAESYLSRLHLSLAEAAYLLGFSDQSSFFRACRRWFGLPPGEYRRHLQRPPPGAAGNS